MKYTRTITHVLEMERAEAKALDAALRAAFSHNVKLFDAKTPKGDFLRELWAHLPFAEEAY